METGGSKEEQKMGREVWNREAAEQAFGRVELHQRKQRAPVYIHITCLPKYGFRRQGTKLLPHTTK